MEVRKVMLIEDEELIREGLKSILDWEGLDMEVVYAASNGEEALAFLKRQSVDMIVTDISMPVMDGLSFLAEFRELDKRARCVILTGYEEFDYARKAISLDVEDYILKPIDEVKLEDTLVKAALKLQEIDKKSISGLDTKAGWIQLLTGKLSPEKVPEYLALLPLIEVGKKVYPSVMKISLETLKEHEISDILLEIKGYPLLEGWKIRVIYLSSDTLLLLCFAKSSHELAVLFEGLQNQLESELGVLTFISVGNEILNYVELKESYELAQKLQKYRLVEGYGSCVTAWQMQNRQSQDVELDESCLRKLVLKKDKEGILIYIEDLFINNIKENVSIEDIYQLSLKTAMLLQEIKKEYQLLNKRNMQNLTELVDSIYQAEDLSSLKGVFVNEIVEILDCMNENNSQYTPVVKQIISEVQQNYREDMNLKTLSYKYHMNTSYLGQIFQKETGCSFSQYLSNIKNSKAKELLLNSNMKINDIAKEVGYLDTSYFYRKFKQCYGISPAAMREMKKY